MVPEQPAARLTRRGWRFNAYLMNGGTIVFDTRDRSIGGAADLMGGGPGAQRLRQLAEGLDIPPLEPVPPDHVLTKAFYLMQDFPGRYAGGEVWVQAGGEETDGDNDGVSPVVIGAVDWAGAWAIDGQGRPLYATVPGGERQREDGLPLRRQPRDVRPDRQLQGRSGARPGDPGTAGAMTAMPKEGPPVLNQAASMALAPMLPWAVLAPLFAAAGFAVAYAFLRRARGAVWRLLAGPGPGDDPARPLAGGGAARADRRRGRRGGRPARRSQDLGDRAGRTDRALADLTAALEAEEGLEVRIVEAGGAIDETELIDALDRATADVPRRRLAGAVLITDGQVHDVPAAARRGWPTARADAHPAHRVCEDEADRRIVVVNGPRLRAGRAGRWWSRSGSTTCRRGPGAGPAWPS